MIEVEGPFAGFLEKSQEDVLYFKEKGQNNFLVIQIPSYYIDLLDIKLEKIPLAYPLPHDLFRIMLKKFGAEIDRGIITSIDEDNFCRAKLVVKIGKKEISIDCGPTDLYFFKMDTPFPIYAENVVFLSGTVNNSEDGQARITFESGKEMKINDFLKQIGDPFNELGEKEEDEQK